VRVRSLAFDLSGNLDDAGGELLAQLSPFGGAQASGLWPLVMTE
jgi:hypothetical protein